MNVRIMFSVLKNVFLYSIKQEGGLVKSAFALRSYGVESRRVTFDVEINPEHACRVSGMFLAV
jgi:hypothetical protein